MIKLAARAQDDLNWQIEEGTKEFEFDLGLHEPFFPLEDELRFQALSSALTHFTKEVWPHCLDAKGILYRGSADFSRYFKWSERQEENFSLWKKDQPAHAEVHLKRLFCAESFVHYFQMLAHRLPDEMPLSLVLDLQGTGSFAQTLHLISAVRFEHFQLDTGLHFSSNQGVCFPVDELCSEEVLEAIDSLFQKIPTLKPVYEPLLTEQWDGLDELFVFPEALTPQGQRKLLGFVAAGGVVKEIRGRGI